MPAELPTPSKAAPNPRLRQRNETIPPRRSFLRGLDRPLGMGFSRENLVAGLVAGSAAGRGVSENIRHGWHSAPGYRHYHAPAADRLCHRPYWWIASRVINGALGTFSRYRRDARARIANTAQRVLGPARAFVVWANGSSDAFRRGNGNALVRRHRNRHWRAPCPPDLPAGRAHHGIKAFAHLAKSDLTRSPPLYCSWNEARLGVRLAFPHGGGNFRDYSNG